MSTESEWGQASSSFSSPSPWRRFWQTCLNGTLAQGWDEDLGIQICKTPKRWTHIFGSNLTLHQLCPMSDVGRAAFLSKTCQVKPLELHLFFIFVGTFFFSTFIEVWLTNKSWIYLRCTMWCFDTHIYCEMIHSQVKVSVPHIVIFSFLVTSVKAHSLSRFQVRATVLSTRAAELWVLHIWNFVHFYQHFPIFPW